MKARVVTAIVCALAAGAVALAAADLPERYEKWLHDVGPLMNKAERKTFLKLDKDHQRDAFIERFWAERDPVPQTQINEFRIRYERQLEEALQLYERLNDDRAVAHALNGPPTSVMETDCGVLTWPLELWTYDYSAAARGRVQVIFYQNNSAGPFRLWSPADGHSVLLMTLNPATTPDEQRVAFHTVLRKYCTELSDVVDALLYTFRLVEIDRGWSSTQVLGAPGTDDPEWASSFHAFSTDVADDAAPLTASFDVGFPGAHQSRTRVEATLSVPVEEAALSGEADQGSYNFQLIGEVMREEVLFESFRYRFDVLAAQLQSDAIALSFERLLRPASYRWIVKLEDVNGQTVFREEFDVSVPRVDGSEPSAFEEADGTGATDEVAAGEVSISLSEPPEEILSGPVRFTAAVTGEGVTKVRFMLDGKPLLSKTRPPYSVDFDLGSRPDSHTVRVVALGAGGEELATDELLVNPGKQSFIVSLAEPREGAMAAGSVRTRADVIVPEGQVLDRVEFFVGDRREATLYQEPFTQTVQVEAGELGYLRVVAYLEDGSESEDWVIVNAPDFGESVEVRLVELYAAVLDGSGRPVQDLVIDDFEVQENGSDQQVVRFEHLRDLPLYAGLMIDTSASMAESFEEVSRMGRTFLEESIRPKDRAAVITFSEQPRLAAAFTNELPTLFSALGGLKAERGTALWDSLVFAIDYFRGIRGQRALVLLSDGEDRRSTQTFEDALQFAQGTGVTVYTVGLESEVRRVGKTRLTRLAEQTGGRAFYIRSIDKLAEVYSQIQADLRSRYLLTYQSTNTGGEDFRAIEVEVSGRDLEVRTLRGYFP